MTGPFLQVCLLSTGYSKKYSRTPFTRINWDGEPYGYAANLENFIFLWKRVKLAVRICGNKMPTRCNRWFYCRYYCLLNMFRGNIMPIIRSSRVLYKWLLPVGLVGILFPHINDDARSKTKNRHREILLCE